MRGRYSKVDRGPDPSSQLPRWNMPPRCSRCRCQLLGRWVLADKDSRGRLRRSPNSGKKYVWVGEDDFCFVCADRTKAGV